MGDGGPTHQVGTFSSSADDLHTRGILPVVYSRDCLATWGASVHSIEQGSQVYDTLLEEFPKDYGGIVDDEHYISSADRWPIEEDHTGYRGHAMNMLPRS